MELSEIKIIRKRLNLTQAELAKKAEVSQSLIAKIESDRIDPTFNNAKKIFQALETLTYKSEITAEQIMNKKIIYVDEKETVKEAISKMKKHGISQLPVLNNGVSGLISESTIIEHLSSDITSLKVSDIMEDAPPVISKKTTKSIISDLLKYCPVVLVSEKGRLIGLITKADLLNKI
jgi:predicted transcriptional regulator